MSDRIVLNVNDGVDTIHVNPIEECNVDDVEGRKSVDPLTAAALLDRGEAVRCQHCNKEEPRS